MQEFLEYFRDINKEIPVLESRYNRLIQLFEDNDIKDIDDFVNQKITDKIYEYDLAEQCIDLARDVSFRAKFDAYLQLFFDSLDLLFNISQAKRFHIPAKRFGYLLMRMRNRYKDSTMDLKWAKEKVRKIIDEYLISHGIDSKIEPVSLLSDDFPKELAKVSHNSKAKASEMEHAIRWHIKINMEKDPVYFKKFYQKMEDILRRFKDNWDRISQELDDVRNNMLQGREDDANIGLDKKQMPFYEIILVNSYGEADIQEADQKRMANVTSMIYDLLKANVDTARFWKKDAMVRTLQGEIEDLLKFSGDAKMSEKNKKLSVDILALAKKRHEELIGNDDQ